jgi:hypothetical protein
MEQAQEVVPGGGIPDAGCAVDALATRAPEGLNTAPVTGQPWSSRRTAVSPEERSQILTVASSLAVISRVPSGLNDAANVGQS